MSGQLGSIYNNVSFALNLHTTALAKLQEQVSTGSRVNRASDDPSAAFQILNLKSQARNYDNYISNMDTLSDVLELSNTVIQSMSDSIVEAKQVISQVTSGIYDEDARERTAQQINDILEQMVLFGNSRHLEQYIFGGSDSASPPYVVERTDGKIASVTYQGGSGVQNIEIAPSVQSNIFYVGDDIFRSDERSTPVFAGTTGANAGTGTSSVQGDVWLTVTFDGSNYQISIDDGASYTTVPVGGNANQAVTDSTTGKVLYVDTTGINSTGVEMARVPGTYDIFNTLISVRDVFSNERGLSEDQLKQIRNGCLESLEEVGNLLVHANVIVGARIGFLEDFKNNLTEMKYSFEDQTANLEDADITQIAVDLSRREILYQMSLSVAAEIMSLSLLNFLD